MWTYPGRRISYDEPASQDDVTEGEAGESRQGGFSTTTSSSTTTASGPDQNQGWNYDTSYRYIIKHRPNTGLINAQVIKPSFKHINSVMQILSRFMLEPQRLWTLEISLIQVVRD